MATHETHRQGGPASQAAHEHPAQTVNDPVCNMTVDPHTAKHKHSHEGRPYYFCSAKCRQKFIADPAAYSVKDSKLAARAPEGTIYTCPMHPQVQQAGPGSCPICGMALEPETVSADTMANPELADMTRRFWIAFALTAPVFILEMGAHLTSLHQYIGQQTSNWVQLFFATPVVLWTGWPFFKRAWVSLKTRDLNMFTLIAMGTGVALQYHRHLAAGHISTCTARS
jgi:YHS domain-containing protein